jgi:hypothetical protein
MFTFGFFVKVFFSGLIGAYITSNLATECLSGDSSVIKDIGYYILSFLLLVACGCVAISIFGIIWTF